MGPKPKTQAVDVLAGILLASRDCHAQGNSMAANELLDVKAAVAALLEAASLIYAQAKQGKSLDLIALRDCIENAGGKDQIRAAIALSGGAL